jgi:linoleoyl-CoA desaturase
MKDRHIQIASDSALLKTINAAVGAQLRIDPAKTRQKLLGKAAFYLSATALAYSTIYAATTPLALTGAYVLYGMASLLLAFNFAHDFSHNAVFKNKKINNLCYTLIYTLVGAHAESWKRRHVHAHHYAPNVRGYDTDLQITALIRVDPGAQLRGFHRFQHLYAPFAYATYSLFWVFVKDFVIYSTEFRSQKPAYHLSFWLQKTAYLAYLLVFPLLFSPVHPLYVVAAFFIMHFVQSVFLLFTFFMTHHVEKTQYFDVGANGDINTSWLNNQLRSSNDFYPFSEAANFIFGGFNNHIAHHLFPHINHVHYPRLNRILYGVLRENGQHPNVTTFFGGATSHLRHLKTMGVGAIRRPS